MRPSRPWSAVITVPRSTDSTTQVTLGTRAATRRTFYWRVSASDGALTSAYSNVHAFMTADGAQDHRRPRPTTPTPTATPRPRCPPTAAGQPDAEPAGRPAPAAAEHVLGRRRTSPRQYPSALRNSCQESGGTWEFMDRVVDRLRTYRHAVGLQLQARQLRRPVAGRRRLQLRLGPRTKAPPSVYIIDIVGGHCGSNPTPVWIDETGVTPGQRHHRPLDEPRAVLGPGCTRVGG